MENKTKRSVLVILCLMIAAIIFIIFGDNIWTKLFSVALIILLGLFFYSRLREYGHVNLVLRRHMDGGISSILLGRDEKRKKGEISNTAVMFADVCNFTAISDSMDAETLMDFLNTYFEICEKCIHENGGVIDKYIGDCVMAFWKEEDDGSAAQKACKAALAISNLLKQKCSEINDRFSCDLEFSAGINYGMALMGDVGCETRKDFTVIGDVVNLAARLQSIAPAGGIYLSEMVAKNVTDEFNIKKIPKKVPIKGKCDPIDIYTLLPDKDDREFVSITESKHSSGFVMYICGSRGSYSLAGKRYAEFGGETSCYLFKKKKYALIVDCGSGLQRARNLLEECETIDIVLTHLHYDHVMGLLDWSIFPQNAKITFYGTFEKWLGDKSISKLLDEPYWPVNLFRGDMVNVERLKEYCISPDVKLVFYKASHPNEANLLTVSLSEKKICVMADCEHSSDLPLEVVKNCDVLIYDGMYEDMYYNEHIGWGHSTWEEGVRLAIKATPGRLIISHHNPRNSDEKLRGLEIKAQEEYPSTVFAKAGDRFVL